MIPVCWFEGIAGLDKYSAQFANEGVQGRSRYACCGLLNDAFDSYGDTFIHYSGWDGMPRGQEVAVVIVHGGHLRYQVDQINDKINQLQAVLLIGIGDEENDFPYASLTHRNSKLWMQSPIVGKSKADRFPIVGYPCDIHEHLVIDPAKPMDWFFAGQITHQRRTDCVNALKEVQSRGTTTGLLHETQQFYSGLDHDTYFKTLGKTKIVPCPSGPVNSDTFRLAEALEAGCIPIVDEHPGWHQNRYHGFFSMLFPQGFPFPVVDHWKELPDLMDNMLREYPVNAQQTQAWWADYKRDYYSWFRTDLKALGVSI